ncbi:MAG TPA: hypothetical protein VEV81_12960 [Pyrinomonadaceae bacterium]|jgi:hypothetical protein|nr:hypothetical protein [Pyrinomonadaceae bacterium]
MTEQNTGTGKAEQNEAVDDRGTNQSEGRALLKRLRDQGFDSDDEKLAVALGRPVEEVGAWMDGGEEVDDDVIMKARGIAKERGIEIE